MREKRIGDPYTESKHAIKRSKEMKDQIRDLQKTLQRELDGLYLGVMGIEARLKLVVEAAAKQIVSDRETQGLDRWIVREYSKLFSEIPVSKRGDGVRLSAALAWTDLTQEEVEALLSLLAISYDNHTESKHDLYSKVMEAIDKET